MGAAAARAPPFTYHPDRVVTLASIARSAPAPLGLRKDLCYPPQPAAHLRLSRKHTPAFAPGWEDAGAEEDDDLFKFRVSGKAVKPQSLELFRAERV